MIMKVLGTMQILAISEYISKYMIIFRYILIMFIRILKTIFYHKFTLLNQYYHIPFNTLTITISITNFQHFFNTNISKYISSKHIESIISSYT